MTPYQREMNLFPHILRMEQQGINIHTEHLDLDTNYYYEKLDELDQQICAIVKADIDVDSNDSLADALEKANLSKGFATTATGKRSVAKESLINAVADPTLLGHLLVRGALATCLRTFMQPWLIQAQANNGKLYVRWNQIRNYTDTGARTGRLSSSPNLQNIPVLWEGLLSSLAQLDYTPQFSLPHVRDYVIPAPGCVFIGRDYAAQEMRLLAHFAGGGMLETLKANPTKDVHMIAADIAGITRRVAKTLGFAVLYGAGVGRIAESLGISVGEATSIKRRYLEALPEIKKYQKSLSDASSMGQPIHTLGGRQYYVQPPAIVAGKFRSFEYKLTNYAIQGSASDQTKEAMYQYCSKTKHGRLALSVHDQIVVEAPQEHVEEERKILEEAVNGAFQEVLKYKVISDEAIGNCFGALK